MKLIIAKTILALFVLSLNITIVINPLLAVPFLGVPIGILVAWALNEVVDDKWRKAND